MMGQRSNPIPPHPIPFHPIQSHPIPSNPINSHAIQSHPIPSPLSRAAILQERGQRWSSLRLPERQIGVLLEFDASCCHLVQLNFSQHLLPFHAQDPPSSLTCEAHSQPQLHSRPPITLLCEAHAQPQLHLTCLGPMAPSSCPGCGSTLAKLKSRRHTYFYAHM